MSKQRLAQYVTHLLTILGVSLMLAGGAMWWRQTRLEARLLSQEERVLLAVTAEPAPPEMLPEFNEGRTTVETVTPLPPTSTPVPTISTIPMSGTTRAERLAEPFDSTVAPTPTATVTPTPDPFPPASTIPSRLTIPAIGLDTQVVEMGWAIREDGSGNRYSEWVVPAFAAGWHKNSSLPGHGGNTVLSGHHNIDGEIFRYLADVEPGAEVQLEAAGVTYQYRVEEKYIVAEKGQPLEVRRENNRYIEPTEDERLTLLTCWPYETNTHRVIVIARPIVAEASADPVAESLSHATQP